MVLTLTLRGCDQSPRAMGESGADERAIRCECELSSWIIAGRARHLYLTIDCPEGFDELDGVVEFTDETARDDYVERRDDSGALVAPRVARKPSYWVLRPYVDDPDERVEASWRITVEQARILQRDRIWETPYVLTGPNSNSAMVAALLEAGLTAPARVLEGGGIFGEFPGIEQAMGASIDPE